MSLTASWESGDNSATLADATSGEAKKYTADGEPHVLGNRIYLFGFHDKEKRR